MLQSAIRGVTGKLNTEAEIPHHAAHGMYTDTGANLICGGSATSKRPVAPFTVVLMALIEIDSHMARTAVWATSAFPAQKAVKSSTRHIGATLDKHFGDHTAQGLSNLDAVVELAQEFMVWLFSGDVYAHIDQNIGQWIETSIASR
ncbi:MAG: hypothetical protein V5B40_07095 [Candidatus Accumulibacter meliphilus]|jgi:hypothetical protein|uniref:hypothetical protein n=1 Tax=Candidatus Accumulibacter meliphilus TaxID=2211374 RepID=UPI002FC2E6D7